MARRRRSFSVTGRGVAWAALLTATGGAAVMAGITASTRGLQPAVALAITPGDGPALAQRATEILLNDDTAAADVSRARADAMAALARDATLTEAWRTVALSEPEGSAAAFRLLQTAQSLSRRDLPTQLALIEYQVQKGDIAGALRHYDAVLRISSAFDSVLFPILTSASTDPAIRRVLVPELVAAPIWRRRFLSYVVNANTPIDRQADLYAALAAAGPLADRDIVATQATNSALAGQYAVSDRLFRIVDPARAKLPIRDGSFSGEGAVPPYGWQFDVGDTLDVVVAANDGNPRLEVMSRRGDGVRTARQLVSLSPGAHRLTLRHGAIEGVAPAALRVTVTCAEGNAAIATFDATGSGTAAGDVVVPAGCRWQWLEIAVKQNPQGSPVGAWIDDIAVAPAQRIANHS